MKKTIPAAKKLVVGALAVGALTLGSSGLVGAASAPTPPKAARQFNCANATKVLTRIDKGRARIAAGLPRLTAAEAKATANGHTVRADRLKRRITRLESARVKARLVKATAAIEAKCHVPDPGTAGSSGTGSPAQA